MEYDDAYEKSLRGIVCFSEATWNKSPPSSSVTSELMGWSRSVAAKRISSSCSSRAAALSPASIHTYEGENPAVQRRIFGDGVTVSARGIVLRHVLEHVQDPVGFLDGLREANGGGLIYIEVPCFDWILRASAWFDIFYEHVNYFRACRFLERMFGRVVEGGHLFGGQYLYVVA